MRNDNGNVIVAGGNSSSAEIFNPTLNTWNATGALTTYRSANTAVLLGNGNVFADGGYGITNSELSSAEIQAEQVRAGAEAEIEGLRRDLGLAGERVRTVLGHVLPAAREVAQAAEFAFARGAVSVLDLLDASRQLRAAR